MVVILLNAQESKIDLLFDVPSNPEWKVREMVEANGGVDAVMRAMRAHVHRSDIQEQGCGLLHHLFRKNANGVCVTTFTC
jgi:hypothetical protein